MSLSHSSVRRLAGFTCAVSLTVALLGCVSTPLTYPQARVGAVVDNYHGTNVPDPYRWLEDPDSPESRAWIKAENKITFRYLNSIPERRGIKNRLTKIW